MASNLNYDIILGQTTLNTINNYKSALYSNITKAGAYLGRVIKNEGANAENTPALKLIQLLLWTKTPMIFAESGVRGDGSDWNHDELTILGDLSIAMNVKIYDNGVWSTTDRRFRQHPTPFDGSLVFVPGPLLESNCTGGAFPDLQEILNGNDHIDQDKYNRLINRRLTPVLYYINESAAKQNVSAIVTIPGIGCGAFAGRFKGTMGERLNVALQSLLTAHAHQFDKIACIHFDPHRECTNQNHDFGNVKYRVRPTLKNSNPKSLLCEPNEYEEQGDDFSNSKLFKIVAWDHVSFPGNDFFGDSRFTDDGVSAAATNSMEIITGVNGHYRSGKYLPPAGHLNWLQVAREKNVKLQASEQNIYIARAIDPIS